MKAVILAGGYGTRISEESAVRPKPMVEIGDKPILWHIMKLYAANGVTEFVIAVGYRGYLIKEYFANYYLHTTDITVDLQTNTFTQHASAAEPWRVTIVDTGDGTITGGRLRRLREFIEDDTFCLTYGDCVSDIDIAGEIAFHKETGAGATVAAVQPPGRSTCRACSWSGVFCLGWRSWAPTGTSSMGKGRPASRPRLPSPTGW